MKMEDNGPCWLPILGPGGAPELGETSPMWVGVGALQAESRLVPGQQPAPGHHKVMVGSLRNRHWVMTGYGCSGAKLSTSLPALSLRMGAVAASLGSVGTRNRCYRGTTLQAHGAQSLGPPAQHLEPRAQSLSRA